mmetsp:Transcript_19291/g.53890  ORF Transcript_19291/g.53890 Transcript_19291/m.53890 type:complete len:263 (-) Transcript_19291:227-1015(-)
MGQRPSQRHLWQSPLARPPRGPLSCQSPWPGLSHKRNARCALLRTMEPNSTNGPTPRAVPAALPRHRLAEFCAVCRRQLCSRGRMHRGLHRPGHKWSLAPSGCPSGVLQQRYPTPATSCSLSGHRPRFRNSRRAAFRSASLRPAELPWPRTLLPRVVGAAPTPGRQGCAPLRPQAAAKGHEQRPMPHRDPQTRGLRWLLLPLRPVAPPAVDALPGRQRGGEAPGSKTCTPPSALETPRVDAETRMRPRAADRAPRRRLARRG